MVDKLNKHERANIIIEILKEFPNANISHLCNIANISRTCYYNLVTCKTNPSIREKQDKEDFDLIKWAYNFKSRPKGARLIKMTLQNILNINMGLRRIRRLMRKFDLVCPIRKSNPYKKMQKSIKENSVVPNIVNRNFDTGIPRKIILTDITYIKYNGKFAYLSTMLDGCTREILAYKLSKTLYEDDLTLPTLKELAAKNILRDDTLIHSDQGVHYRTYAFQKLIKKLKLTQSMSRLGNCWDNAPQESFFGHMKDNLNVTSGMTFELLQNEIDDYIQYYNNFKYSWQLNRLAPTQYYQSLAN